MGGKKKWKCTGPSNKPHEERFVEDGLECIDCGATSPHSTGQPQTSSGSTSSTQKTTSPTNNSNLPIVLGAVILGVGILGGAVYGFIINKKTPEPTPEPTISNNNTPDTKECLIFQPTQEPERFSLGQRSLFQGEPNIDLNRGTEKFKIGNYEQAKTFFDYAVDAARTDPEPQIYRNNAQARQEFTTGNKGCPLTIAVVVPSKGDVSKPKSAQEILRGIADVQTQVNEAGGIQNRLLEIVIVNDGNESKIAPIVAQELSKNPYILAVIGHNSSDASIEALPTYETQQLAMISPTSTAISLHEINQKSEHKVFFRTVPSDAANAPILANYAEKKLNAKKIVIFYDSKSVYSKSLTEEIENALTSATIMNKISIEAEDFDVEKAVNSIKDEADTAILLPSVNSTSIAVRIAKKLKANTNIKLLGGDALYSPTTLEQGGNDVNNLYLVVPVAPSDTYTNKSQKVWGGNINWRTVASFDAAEAIIQAIKATKSPENVTRQDVLKELKSITIKTDGSGKSWKFDQGEPKIDPCIVKVDKDAPAPQGVEFGFKTLKCG
ncbi:ABC transporter substrate-binding protein [Aphanothece sacrum]|uniref:Leucine-binding protein domain-containing protein n=1 Tax=Aphanothece sacrum FPU1 TaxID=1920663 RepID=A0A401IC43_APHSA|nr:ABC transporter substrate-binding protein [Aphanothece sacrum]GBF78794.1 hypothetical protein AsFPU1_0184 [Aphanothece sacrum FPU1]GBF83026.1 receptor ligand binding region family protein [Aphanothece sacrum FPU3]